MLEDFDHSEIESVKDSIQNNLLGLVENYLENHCSLVEESLYGYEGCCKTKRVNTDQDMEEAIKKAKQVLIEIIKTEKFSF